MKRLQYEDLESHRIIILSDGRVIVFRRSCLEIWDNDRKLEIPVPHYFENQWYITEDEACILGSFKNQVIIKWSLDTGQKIQVYQNNIVRPDQVPSSTLKTNNEDFQPVSGCYLWRTEAGTFAHVGDGPRGWVTPIALSNNGKFTVIPGMNNAALIDLESGQSVISVLPFEGRLRASCILDDQILIVNSAGRLFINKLKP